MKSINTLEARRSARLRELAAVGPFVTGSLVKVRVRCGNPNCRCASGQRHEAHIVSRKEKGRTASYHVPTELLEDVRRWAAEYRNVKRLIREIASLGEQIVRLHVRTRRAKQKRARTLMPRKSPPSP
jgi:hypothetical protein